MANQWSNSPEIINDAMQRVASIWYARVCSYQEAYQRALNVQCSKFTVIVSMYQSILLMYLVFLVHALNII